MTEPASVQSLEQVTKMLAEIASYQCPKAREQLLENYVNQDKFLALLKCSLFTDIEGISPDVKQKVANMLDRVAVMRMQIEPTPANLQAIFQLHFDVLFDWKLPHNVKKFFSSSITESLDIWQEELDEFWETAIEISLELLEKAGNQGAGCNKNVGKAIKTTFMPEPVEITLSEPYNKADVLTTIFFFLGIFFDKFMLRSEAYKLRGVEMLKQVHRLVFTEEFILQHTVFVHKLLSFQQDFIANLPSEERLRQVAVELCNWNELPKDMFTILRLKAVPFKDYPDSFNIFLLSEHWESNALIDLKTQALDIINGIVLMSDLLDETPEQTLSAISLDYSCNSLYCSLMWLAQQERIPTENEYLLELSMLSNLTSYVAIFKLEMRQYHQILSSLALPIINFEVERNTKTYEDDPAVLDKLITNCIGNDKENDRLPVACSLFDMVMQATDQLADFMRGYFISILAGRCGKDELALPLQSKEAASMPVLSVETCFLLLSVMDYKVASSIQWKALQSILTQETFRSFNPNQKIYFYCFLSVSYEKLYDASNPCDFVFTYPFEQGCPSNVQYFGLSMYSELEDFYSDIFARNFFENFQRLRELDSFYAALMRLIKCLNRVNEYSVCRMVDDCVGEAKRLTKALIKKAANNKATSDDKTFRAMQELSYCSLFAKNHDYVRGKPDLIASLVNAFSLTKILMKINSDDEAVLIGAELLQCVDRFPDGFVNVIPAVIQGFKASEYNGYAYYQFFGSCMDVMGKTPFDETIGSLVSSFYDTFAEGYAYFVTYPDEIFDEQCLNLAHMQALILNLLILFADKLNADCMAEVEKITLEAIEGPYNDDHVIVLRGYNILMLCRVMGSHEYPLQQIHSLLKHSDQFNCKNDAILLIYLLNQIRTQIPVQDHYMLISIVLRLLRAADAFKRTRQVRLKEKLKQNNHIFQRLIYPIQMSMTQIEQANLFLTEYNNQHHQVLQYIVEEMGRHPGEKELLVFLEKAQQAAKNKGLINMGLYDSQEEDEGSQCSEGPKTQPPDEGQRKRKIVKVVGDRDQNGDPQVVYTHMARKRAMQTPPKTQEEVDIARVLKRRKGNESLQRVTKRELMMEKRDRRATRI